MASFYFLRCIVTLGLIAGLDYTTGEDESDPVLRDNPRLDLSAFTDQTAVNADHVQVSVQMDHVQNGLSYHRQGMFVQAVESYRKHLEYDDGNADAWHLMGLATQQKSESEADKANAEIFIKKVENTESMSNYMLNRHWTCCSDFCLCLQAIALQPEISLYHRYKSAYTPCYT